MNTYIVASVTDVGAFRKVNQDNILIRQITVNNKELLLASVCDGMGGLAQGEVASSIANQELSTWLDYFFSNEIEFNVNNITDNLKKILIQANQKIRAYADEQSIRSGTTLSCLLLYDDEYIVIHIGDSRIYQISPEFKQLTEDHSVVAREVRLGNLTEEEAKKDKRRNKIYRSLGGIQSPIPQIISGKVYQDSSFLLCSDGFWHFMAEKDAFDLVSYKVILAQKRMKKKLEKCIQLFMKMGEKDNISAIAIQCISFEKKAKIRLFIFILSLLLGLIIFLLILLFICL